MRGVRLFIGICLLVTLAGPSFAGSVDDAAICQRLTENGKPGWYYYSPRGVIALPSPHANLSYDRDARFSLSYDRDARFFYLAPAKDARVLSIDDNQESVWHIKTVTTAIDRSPATEVIVRRSIDSVSGTLCEGTDLMTFGRDGAFIEGVRYQKHHLNHGASYQNDLQVAFHLAVKDRRESQPSKMPCIRTDHRPDYADRRQAEEDLEKAYNFVDVPFRTHGTNLQLAGGYLFSSAAIAAPAPVEQRAGYGSEIVYIKGRSAVCFSIRAPVPTHLNPVPRPDVVPLSAILGPSSDLIPHPPTPYEQAREDAAKWVPVSTIFEWRPVLSAASPPELSLSRITQTMEVKWQPRQ